MKKGFTLIELLVVVLIIGILAAIALPQYRRTVARSRAMQAIVLAKHFGDICKMDKLAGGTCANLEDMGWGYEIQEISSGDIRTFQIGNMTIQHQGTNMAIYTGLDSVYFFGSEVHFYCLASKTDVEANNLCKGLSGLSEGSSDGNSFRYQLW